MDRADEVWQQPLSRRQLLTAVAAGGASLAIVGCGDGDDDSSSPAQTSNQPKKGGRLTLQAGGEVAAIDPHKTRSLQQSDPWALVTNSVLRLDWKKGTQYDGIVEKWEFPDPTTLVMSVKKNTHWQRESAGAGREIEASDVAASIDRVRTPNDATFLAANALRLVDTIEATDKYTVRVKFKRPDANFLMWMTHPTAAAIVPKEAIARYGANFGVEAWYGSGPFILDPGSFKSGISATFKRNPTYDVDPGGLPYLDEINVLWIADPGTREAAFRTGEIDIGLVPTLQAKEFQGKGYQMGSGENAMIGGQNMHMNTKLAPTNDPRVRQALHRAVDREELLEVVADGYGCTPVVFGCFPDWYLSPTEWAGKPGFRKDKKEDIAEAKKLLDAAGIDPTKVTLKFAGGTTTYKTENPQLVALKGILERNLGFKIELFTDTAGSNKAQQMPLAIHLNNRGGPGIALDDPAWTRLHSTGATNLSLWEDKKTDDLIERQAEVLDNNERKKLMAELQRYVMEDAQMPNAITARNYDYWGARKNVRNWTASTYFLANYGWQFNKIWLDV